MRPSGPKAFYNAIEEGSLEYVKALLKADPSLVFLNNGSMTPLHWAAYWGKKDVAAFLLTSKVEVNAKNGGKTPLHEVADEGNGDAAGVAKVLLANKADVNARDHEGWTPLHAAAAKGLADVVEVLLANGADVNAKNNKGQTALHWAAGKAYSDVAKLLLAHKADVNVRDDNGETPRGLLARENLEGLLTASGNARNRTEWQSEIPIYENKVVAILGELRLDDKTPEDVNQNVVIDTLRGFPALGLSRSEIAEVLENLERKGVVSVYHDLGMVFLTKPGRELFLAQNR
jgi:hypothetical protein